MNPSVSVHAGAHRFHGLRVHTHALRALGERNGQVEQTPRTGNGFECLDLLHLFPCMAFITLKNLATQFQSAIRVRQHKRPGEVEAGIGHGEIGPINNRCATVCPDQDISWMKIREYLLINYLQKLVAIFL